MEAEWERAFAHESGHPHPVNSLRKTTYSLPRAQRLSFSCADSQTLRLLAHLGHSLGPHQTVTTFRLRAHH
jgi:hypothetical protein